MIRAIWAYRGFILGSVKREFQSKESLHKSFQHRTDHYMVGNGASYSIEQFVERAFAPHGLDSKKYFQVDKSFFRPLDIHISRADPSKAQSQLCW